MHLGVAILKPTVNREPRTMNEKRDIRRSPSNVAATIKCKTGVLARCFLTELRRTPSGNLNLQRQKVTGEDARPTMWRPVPNRELLTPPQIYSDLCTLYASVVNPVSCTT